MPETQDWSAPIESPAILTDSGAIVSSEAGTTTVLISGVAGKKITLVRLHATAYEAAGGGGAQVRDYIFAKVYDSSSLAVLAVFGLSPESPFVVDQLVYGAGQADTGHGVTIKCWSRNGAGTMQFWLLVDYYLAV